MQIALRESVLFDMLAKIMASYEMEIHAAKDCNGRPYPMLSIGGRKYHPPNGFHFSPEELVRMKYSIEHEAVGTHPIGPKPNHF